MSVLMPIKIESCMVRSLSEAGQRAVACWRRHSPATYQCVISIVSGPLRTTLAPPGPAIFASRDCAHVTVICGRERDPRGRGRHCPSEAGGAGLMVRA